MISGIPLNKLAPSPRNVRKHSDAAADAELKASIAAVGLLQNLVVRAAPKGRYTVEAGERRRQALTALADDKVLPRDHPVACLVLDADDANAVESSLTENFQRLNMLGHVSRLSFDRKNKRMVCLFQAARSAYPKSWRRAAWNKHLRGGCGIVPLAIGGDESVTRTPLGLSARLSAPHI